MDAQLLAEVYLELTGGRQSSLELNSFKEKTNKINQNEISLKKNDLAVQLFDNEIKEHKKMINKLKKPIWLK